MRRRSSLVWLVLCVSILSLALVAPHATAAPVLMPGEVVLTSTMASYTENFNTLASTGVTSTESTLPLGWTFVETGSNANTIYTVGTGSSATGDTYSFGSTGSTDRALGTLRSGSLVSIIGVQFRNSTGATITRLPIVYTGEQWRLGTVSRVDRLDFQYSTDATSLTSGTWVDVDTLDFTTPNTAGTAGPRDGNLATNRTSLSAAVAGLTIPNGTTFWLRWVDFDASGADDGLAVDDFSLSGILPVDLAAFSATGEEGAVAVEWETVAETDNLGFHLWRATAPDTSAERITGALIPAQAPGSGQGAAYTWHDASVQVGTTYYYWLEDVSTSGATTWYGPVSATPIVTTAVALGALTTGDRGLTPWLALAGFALLGLAVWTLRRR